MFRESALTISNVYISSSSRLNSTARFASWTWAEHSTLSIPASNPAAVGYSYVWEDLSEIASSIETWSDDGLAPSAGAIRAAVQVIRQTESFYPAPEITALDNGTLLIFWHAERGYLSLELGSDQFGLLGTREGFPSLRKNGDSAALLAALPQRKHHELQPNWSVFGPAEIILDWGREALTQLREFMPSASSSDFGFARLEPAH